MFYNLFCLWSSLNLKKKKYMPSFASREQSYNFCIHWKALSFEFEWIQAFTEAATSQLISQNVVFFVVFQFVWQRKTNVGQEETEDSSLVCVLDTLTLASVLLINSKHQTECQCEMCIDKFNMVPLKIIWTKAGQELLL